MKRPLTLTFFLVLFQLPAFSQEKILFGVVPQQTPSQLVALWQPQLNYLEKKLKIKILFETAPSIPEFEERLKNGRYDLAYMNPYHYTHFHKQTGYTAINKAKNKKIVGLIVVKKNSGIHSLKQLHNKKIAFPSPAAFAASIIPRAYLKKEKIRFEPTYVNSHDSVYLSVDNETFIAGGGISRTLKSFEKKNQKKLKVLWKSQGFTSHPIAYHPRLKPKLRIQLQQGLLEISHLKDFKEIFDKLQIVGWEQAQDSDWNDIRRLNLHELE